MNETYSWRQRYRFNSQEGTSLLKAKIAVKTSNHSWINTSNKIIVPISIASAFHNDWIGTFKMEAMIQAIRDHINSKITIFFSEDAHLSTFCWTHKLDLETGSIKLREQAYALYNRLMRCFEECEILFWDDIATQSPDYSASVEEVRSLYLHNQTFKQLIEKDVHEGISFVGKENDCPDLQNAVREDLFRQCAYYNIFKSMGFKYEFYPGRPHNSTQFICKHVHPTHTFRQVYLFVSVESKSKRTLIESCETSDQRVY